MKKFMVEYEGYWSGNRARACGKTSITVEVEADDEDEAKEFATEIVSEIAESESNFSADEVEED
jgi:hypothetical protein